VEEREERKERAAETEEGTGAGRTRQKGR